jgi:hypothetical protein
MQHHIEILVCAMRLMTEQERDLLVHWAQTLVDGRAEIAIASDDEEQPLH